MYTRRPGREAAGFRGLERTESALADSVLAVDSGG